MTEVSKLRNLGRLIYTQNPFYLISCCLILYGFRSAVSAHDLASRAILLAGCIAGYTLLMTITCIGVVRFWKVWEDARSIFLLIFVSLIGLSASLDELLLWDWSTASSLLAAGMALAIGVAEILLRACRMRLPLGYRISLYALLGVFFLSPVAFGYTATGNWTAFANWAAPIFSVGVAGAILLMVPALRRGPAYADDNNTPWKWPYYPLSLFVVAVVLAGFRAHAVWMSFSVEGGWVRFEPFLLVPLIGAVLIVLVESDHSTSRSLTITTAASAPAVLLLGLSNGGSSYLPIQPALETYAGSTLTITFALLVGFYAYVWVRQLLPHIGIAVAGSLFALAGCAPLPTALETTFFSAWMIGGIATAILLIECLRNVTSETRWLLFSAAVAVTIVMAGRDHDANKVAALWGSVFAVAAMLTLGHLFDTSLARKLRIGAAAALLTASVIAAYWHIQRSSSIHLAGILVGVVIVSLAYFYATHRLGWAIVGTVQCAVTFVALSWRAFESGQLNQANVALAVGIVCFFVALAISFGKTGTVDATATLTQRLALYRSGL